MRADTNPRSQVPDISSLNAITLLTLTLQSSLNLPCPAQLSQLVVGLWRQKSPCFGNLPSWITPCRSKSPVFQVLQTSTEPTVRNRHPAFSQPKGINGFTPQNTRNLGKWVHLGHRERALDILQGIQKEREARLYKDKLTHRSWVGVSIYLQKRNLKTKAYEEPQLPPAKQAPNPATKHNLTA